MKSLAGVAFALLCSVAAAAEPARMVPSLDDPLESLETLAGSVDVQSEGERVFVTLRAQDPAGERLFIVETEGPSGLSASSYSYGDAEVLFWKGHLVVIAARDGQALHFSIPGVDARSTPAQDRARRTPDPAKLDAHLREGYELTRIDRVTALISRGGPRAFDPIDRGELKVAPREEPKEPTGVGSCGKSCTITCGDNSSCSVSCGETRCASCTCPALCKCS